MKTLGVYVISFQILVLKVLRMPINRNLKGPPSLFFVYNEQPLDNYLKQIQFQHLF